LTFPLFSVGGFVFSWRDLILIGGGLFLVWKGTTEIHHRLERADGEPATAATHPGLAATVAQIVALDMVFSLDSVITAVGMANELAIMMTAVVIAVLLMLVAAGPLGRFVNAHPTVKMLALSFLLMIGMTLVADGLGAHVPKGYIYAAMGFSALVESLNLLAARRPRRAGATGTEGA
jgi:predicted tellurium resistance membrane protein TerC